MSAYEKKRTSVHARLPHRAPKQRVGGRPSLSGPTGEEFRPNKRRFGEDCSAGIYTSLIGAMGDPSHSHGPFGGVHYRTISKVLLNRHLRTLDGAWRWKRSNPPRR